MPVETIKIAGTEAPKPGKKRGRIKGEDGRIFQISPLLMEMVKIGSSYDIDYKDEEFGDAKYRVVESLAPAIGGVSNRQLGIPANATYDGPSRRTLRNDMPPPEDERGIDIATLAIAKVWLEKIPVGDQAGAEHALRVARRAWLKFKRNPENIESGQQATRDDEMADEIPEF